MIKSVVKMLTTEMTNDAFREGMVGVNSLLSAAEKTVELTTIAPVFAQTLNEYTRALDNVADATAETKALQEADKEFISYWNRQKNYLYGLKTSFADTDAKNTAQLVYDIMSAEGSLSKLSYEDRYGKAEKLINRLDELDETVLAKADCDIWLKNIKQKLQAVQLAKENRDAAKAAIIIGCRASARAQLELVYTFVVKYINFKLKFGDIETYKELAAKMNVVAKDINAKILAKKSLQNASEISGEEDGVAV